MIKKWLMRLTRPKYNLEKLLKMVTNENKHSDAWDESFHHEKLTKQCIICGKGHNHVKSPYCSLKCAEEYIDKLENMTLEELGELEKENGIDIAELMATCDNCGCPTQDKEGKFCSDECMNEFIDNYEPTIEEKIDAELDYIKTIMGNLMDTLQYLLEKQKLRNEQCNYNYSTPVGSVEQGWQCPACKQVWNPIIMACNCDKVKVEINVTTSTTKVEATND